MLISVAWLNRLLEPGNLTPDEAEHALTFAGFPIESRERLPSGDTRLDVEVTSNRGDMLCHLGCARELGAATGRSLRLEGAKPNAKGPAASGLTSVENRIPESCPLFTARLIRGVTVGPSPKWLVDALESVGQKSVSNVVDASNFILFQHGHPSHAFDFATLRGSRLVIRWANAGEKLLALDGKTYALQPDEMVVADAERAVGLAGVIGGVETSVTARTRDVLLEVATWSPAAVRRGARRNGLRTDASHRYERLVDARTSADASDRLAGLILELAGGELCEGVVDAPSGGVSRLAAARTVVSMRAERCRALIGAPVETAEMARLLTSLDIDARVERSGGAETLRCEIPAHRPDLEREVDLIEEVARTHGLQRVPLHDRIDAPVAPAQHDERAMRLLADTLSALGFFETVTFSFVAREDAAAFMPPGLGALAVDEARRPGEPALRPSVIPSLLRCARANRHAGNHQEGGLRLFETASVFAQWADGPEKGKAIENRNLALLVVGASGAAQEAVRTLRGAIEAAARTLGGPSALVTVDPAPAIMPAFDDRAFGGVSLNGARVGYLGVLARESAARVDIDAPVAGAEISLPALLALFPALSRVRALALFPGVERDLSLVVPESAPWARIEALVRGLSLHRLDGLRFVSTYRGKQVGAGKKSVTLRLAFRDEARTLRHEEVDAEVHRVVEAAQRDLGATLRA